MDSSQIVLNARKREGEPWKHAECVWLGCETRTPTLEQASSDGRLQHLLSCPLFGDSKLRVGDQGSSVLYRTLGQFGPGFEKCTS